MGMKEINSTVGLSHSQNAHNGICCDRSDANGFKIKREREPAKTMAPWTDVLWITCGRYGDSGAVRHPASILAYKMII